MDYKKIKESKKNNMSGRNSIRIWTDIKQQKTEVKKIKKDFHLTVDKNFYMVIVYQLQGYSILFTRLKYKL